VTDRYAVVGNPIAHSKSPQIHTQFAQQTKQDLSYEKLLGEIGAFKATVEQFKAEGGKGLNVTVPFKEDAFAMVDRLEPRAQQAGAVNTLWFEGGSIVGDNTDGVGLVSDLGCNHFFNFANARILLLGSGGASRGVLFPLLDQQPSQIVIANRTVSKAEALARLANNDKVTACGFDALAGQQFDLIINGTAAGLSAEVPPIPDDCLASGGWTYDMMYSTEPTAFVKWGLAHGAAKALDGLGMLVEQAAVAFKIWRGVAPDTESVIAALR